MAEFQFLHAEAPVAQTRNAFKCPVASACPEQALRPTAPNDTSAASTLVAQPCRNGTTGILCASCEPGWRKAPSGRCTQCASSASDGIGFKQLSSGLFLISVGTVVAYVALRKLLTFKRQKRQKSLGAAQSLFAELDSDGSGEITRDEMRANLALLQGMELDEDTAARLIEAIDIDHSGDIDEIEFVAWMEHSTSQLKTSMIVAKIVLGLGQIMSKQPETLKEEFPGPQWDSDWLQVFSFKFDWVLPVCEVDYVQRFFLNTVVLPTFLLSLVAVTWAMNRKSDDEANEAREDFDETKASKRSDYYFAFFLSYPTITQTFFGHFNCRHLSDELSVMEKDCELQERYLPSAFWGCAYMRVDVTTDSVLCSGTQWWLLAVFSAAGILFISIGFPVGMALWMNRYWVKHMRKVRLGEKSRVVAQRDFRRKFGFMSGDFRAEAYYAESVDLIRKLMMSGLLSLIRPGTVFQSFCSVLLSITFMVSLPHAWPPSIMPTWFACGDR